MCLCIRGNLKTALTNTETENKYGTKVTAGILKKHSNTQKAKRKAFWNRTV